jgi:hypothetical protein
VGVQGGITEAIQVIGQPQADADIHIGAEVIEEARVYFIEIIHGASLAYYLNLSQD